MTPDNGEDRRSGAQAVERAIAVLRAFEREDPELGVSQIAESVGLAVSTVHRIVRALVAGGLLAQDPLSQRYHLGATTAVLGQLAVQHLGYTPSRRSLSWSPSCAGSACFLGPVTDVGGLLVRPHDIDVLADAEPASVAARVERLVRLGFEVRVEAVDAEGKQVSVQLTRTQAEALDLGPGKEINLRPGVPLVESESESRAESESQAVDETAGA